MSSMYSPRRAQPIPWTTTDQSSIDRAAEILASTPKTGKLSDRQRGRLQVAAVCGDQKQKAEAHKRLAKKR